MSVRKAMRVAIYARVSTADQTTENQLLELRQYVEQRGWKIASEYIDEGISGSKESRPALDSLVKAAMKKKFDVVLVWKLDRLARSVRHLVLLLDELRVVDIALVSFMESIDFNSSMGKAMFTIIAAMAELERSVIVERVKAGLRRVKKNGKRLGRPPIPIDHAKAVKLQQAGLSLRQIGKQFGVSHVTVSKVLKKTSTGS